MGNRISIISILICAVAVVVGGCSRPAKPPAITPRDTRIPAPSTMVVPVVRTVRPSYSAYPYGWVPPRSRERRWSAIIIHHSGQSKGNMATIDKYHREVNGWDGVGYDFLIGNGRDSGDGLVEVSFRWRKQVAGAHCGGTPNNWANESGIGICLIGDFTKTRPTYRQMLSLKKLVRFLQKRYKIPASRIYDHSSTPGYTRGSKCPGKYFPTTAFKRSL